MGFIDKIFTSYKFDPSICKDGLELACFQQTNVSKLPVNCAAACFQARAADLTAWTSCSWSLSWRRGGGGQSEGGEQARGDCEGGWGVMREDGSEDGNEIELRLGQEIYPSYFIT